ncbi:hypothetical protein FB451DRAFT_1194566 [Mycena latifolia]|nr:hypothetical protein FB451DRAFT_1194566 [Mycena latifolia]
MDSLPTKSLKPGVVNLPGETPASTALVADLVYEDFKTHPCFWNEENFATLYPDCLAFFASKIAEHGVSDALERYVFSAEANSNGALMLAALPLVWSIPWSRPGLGSSSDKISWLPKLEECMWQAALLLGASYDSSFVQIKIYARVRGFSARARLSPTLAEGSGRMEGILRTTALGLRRPVKMKTKGGKNRRLGKVASVTPRRNGRRLHPHALRLERAPAARGGARGGGAAAQGSLLQAYGRAFGQAIILRGRPRIDLALVMGYLARPLPPVELGVGGGSAWLSLLRNAAAHREVHAITSIRTFFYCAREYGRTLAGAVGARDAAGKETHGGAAELDGTLFIRVAGVLTESLGWVDHGEKQGSWDFSGIGWDEAWSE